MGLLIATEIFRALTDGLILAILFGAIASWIWTTRRLLRDRPLLPPTPIVERRKPPWGLGTILLILAAYIFAGHEAFRRAAPPRAGRPEGRAEAPARVEKEAEAPGPAKADAGRGEAAPPHGPSPLDLMAIQGAINGVFILLIPVLARLTCGARLRDLGLSLRDWRRQVAVGTVAVLFLMPIVYSVQAACVNFLALPDQEREKFKHPLEKMLQDTFSPGVAAVAFLAAVVLAPAFEELLFRGVIQSWLVKSFDQLAGRLGPSRSKAVPAPPSDAGPLYDLELDHSPAVQAPQIEYWEAADESSPPPAEDDRQPEDSTTTDAPYRPRSTRGTWAAITLTSLSFAALHVAQWPAPIPLFLLAMGLGIVYQRTGSLLAPICMHAVFNGFSTLMLFHVALQGPDHAKAPAQPVLERAVPAEEARGPVPDVVPGLRSGKT